MKWSQIPGVILQGSCMKVRRETGQTATSEHDYGVIHESGIGLIPCSYTLIMGGGGYLKVLYLNFEAFNLTQILLF